MSPYYGHGHPADQEPDFCLQVAHEIHAPQMGLNNLLADQRKWTTPVTSFLSNIIPRQ